MTEMDSRGFKKAKPDMMGSPNTPNFQERWILLDTLIEIKVYYKILALLAH